MRETLCATVGQPLFTTVVLQFALRGKKRHTRCLSSLRQFLFIDQRLMATTTQPIIFISAKRSVRSILLTEGLS